MRIGINCRSFLRKQYTGIGRYAFNLVQSLGDLDKDDEYFLYAKKGLFDFKRNLPRFQSKNFHPRIDWLNRGVDKTLGNIDIYHSPSPDFLPCDQPKIIVSVHDLIYKTYPQGHTQQTIDQTEEHFQEIVKKAAKIICCSENTRKDLHKYFSVNEQMTCVIHQGVDKRKFYVISDNESHKADVVLRKKGIHRPFVLFIGTIEPRKNLKNLIFAVSILKKKRSFSGQLVIAGMKGWMSEDLSDFIKDENLQDDICILGYVSDEELRILYNKADVFAFPSFYEGFGFPILEAFNCGAAVVTSNTSSCAEVALDAAVQIDPYDPIQISNGIERILDDVSFREDLKRKALKRADDFSFEKTAKQTLDIYREVFES